MIPTPAEVARRRWTLTIIIRAAALLTALSAIAPLAAWLSLGVYDGNLAELGFYAENFLASVVLLIAAAAILRAANRIARWLVPIRPYAVCPACNYRLEGLAEPRCPECGLHLSTEFLGIPLATADDRTNDAAFTLRARETLTIILRLVGLLLILPTILSVILTISWLGAAFYEDWATEFLSIFFGFLLWTVACAAFNIALLFQPRAIARALAPGTPAP